MEHKSMEHLKKACDDMLVQFKKHGQNNVLIDCFNMQKQLQILIKENHPDAVTLGDNPQYVQRQFVNIILEACEGLELAQWKDWTVDAPVDTFEILMELADILHFIFNACLSLGVSADELLVAYMVKNSENAKRQLGISPHSAEYFPLIISEPSFPPKSDEPVGTRLLKPVIVLLADLRAQNLTCAASFLDNGDIEGALTHVKDPELRRRLKELMGVSDETSTHPD